jgi:hypothetical protein
MISFSEAFILDTVVSLGVMGGALFVELEAMADRVGRGELQISQNDNDGWLRKVQRGQAISVVLLFVVVTSSSDATTAGTSGSTIFRAGLTFGTGVPDLEGNADVPIVLVTPHSEHFCLDPELAFAGWSLLKPQTPQVQASKSTAFVGVPLARSAED